MRVNQKWDYRPAIIMVLSLEFFIEDQSTIAQVIPDTTLRNENSIVTPNVTIKDLPASLIEGGAERGVNLFHSFSEFSIGNLQRFYFANPTGIERIFSRVTGNNLSNIDGVLGVLGNADLFFLNPNGIIFGQNASLDVNGSFIGSTADSLVFGDEFIFSASNPTDLPALLTVNILPGLQYGNNPGTITNLSFTNGVGLQVPTNETLGLVGGDIEINGGFISAFGGRVELGSVGENSLVKIDAVDNGYSLNYDGVEQFQDITLNSALVNVNGEGGGDVNIIAKNIALRESSTISAGTFGEIPGGTLSFKASDFIELTDNSLVASFVQPQATGKGADIKITAKQVELTNFGNILLPTFGIGKAGNFTLSAETLKTADGSQIASNTRGQGNAGQLTINANDIELSGFGIIASGETRPGGLLAQVLPGGTGKGGNITITTQTLRLMDTATISNETFSVGDAGDLTIIAEEIKLVGSTTENDLTTNINSTSNRGATGNAGNINIQTNSLFVLSGAGISALSFSDGKPGNINIDANNIELVGVSDDGEVPSALVTQVTSSTRSENESSLIITTNRLKIADGAQISASTFGDGKAGNIKIEASEIELTGSSFNGQNSSGIRSQVNPSATGTAGNIEIFADYLKITDGAKVSVSTFGDGNGGNLAVNAKEIEVIGANLNNNSFSGLFSESLGTGDGGKLTVNTEKLSILNQGVISASSKNTGLAGNLEINAQSVNLDDGAITTETDAGDGGNITLEIQDLLLLRNQSNISTTAGRIGAGGDGGDITINSDLIVAFPEENSDITANAFNGRGGNVNITTQGLFGLEFRPEQTPFSDITASSEFGLNGDVTINTPDVNPAEGLINLPQTFAIPPLDTSCQAQNSNNSSFINLGRGGLPETPRNIRSNQEIWEDLRSPNVENFSNKETQSIKYNPIIEAQSWIVGENGNIILVANVDSKNYKNPNLINSCN